MKNEQLVLYPENTHYQPKNIQALLDELKQAGFLGAAIGDQSAYRFNIGKSFSRLISFLGCSPTIPNSNKTSDKSSPLSIEFVFHDSGSRFLGGKNVAYPGCPNCKHEFSDWLSLAQQWPDNKNKIIVCPDCKNEALIPDLNWRYRAAFASCAIIINEISEGIALPADELLEILTNYSGCSWHYFYRQI